MIEIFSVSKKLDRLELKDLKKNKDRTLWLDISGISKDEEVILQDVFDLHPLSVEDLHNPVTRIKVEEFNKYLFCVFYGVLKKGKVDLVELDFIIGRNFVISNHRVKVDSFEELKNNKARLEELLRKGPDFLLHRLLDREVDNFFPILEEFDDEIDKLEERVTKKVSPDIMNDILKLKRQISRIKKFTLPQREKIGFLTKNDYDFISKKALPYFRDVYDHAVRVADQVDNHREAAANAFDVYMSAMSNNMNEVMKVLSIIATIALPLTVISGIYGTNFANLPGAMHTYGFWMMIGGMVLLVAVMVIFFKRRGWF